MAAATAMVQKAPSYDPSLGVPARAFLGQVGKYAAMEEFRRLTELRRRQEGKPVQQTCLNAPLQGEEGEDGGCLIDGMSQKREPDPAAAAEAVEQVQRRRQVFRLQEHGTSQAQDGALEWMRTLREACFDAVSATDMKDVMKAVVQKAKKGNLSATKVLLDYLCGGKISQSRPTVVIQQAIGDIREAI
jgi:hypothetical protein